MSAAAGELYIQAGVAEAGTGSRQKPLGSLAEAQARSSPGDSLFLLPGRDGAALEGGLVLKPRQKLIGLGHDGRRLRRGWAPLVRIVTPGAGQAKALVRVATGVEVAGVHFDVAAVPALAGPDTAQADPFSGAQIHDNLFTGQKAEAGDVVYAVDLDALTGSVRHVRIHDNVYRDGGSMGGVRVSQRGRSQGQYRFQRNSFFNLGARAYYVLTTEDAQADTEILDSVADNIGRGARNSDSILPYLMQRSKQTMLVRGYRYSNTAKVGNASNCGLEVWIFGGRGEPGEWCVACRIRLAIEDSVFDGAVTDAIQLSNAGSNTVMDVAIRNSRITNANPRQVGGAVSLGAEGARSSGSRSTLLVETSDLSGSAKYAVAVTDATPGSSAVVDLGGGALGSRGRNRLSGAGAAAIETSQVSISARHNWWGEGEPKILTKGEGVVVDIEPRLRADPGPPRPLTRRQTSKLEVGERDR